MGEDEAGARIIVLLRHHAIETHRAFEPGECRLPDREAEPASAQVRPADVEADEMEAARIPGGGNDRRQLIAEEQAEEGIAILREEGGGIGEAGIPALGRGPVHGGEHFGGGEGANGGSGHRHSGSTGSGGGRSRATVSRKPARSSVTWFT